MRFGCIVLGVMALIAAAALMYVVRPGMTFDCRSEWMAPDSQFAVSKYHYSGGGAAGVSGSAVELRAVGEPCGHGETLFRFEGTNARDVVAEWLGLRRVRLEVEFGVEDAKESRIPEDRWVDGVEVLFVKKVVD